MEKKTKKDSGQNRDFRNRFKLLQDSEVLKTKDELKVEAVTFNEFCYDI